MAVNAALERPASEGVSPFQFSLLLAAESSSVSEGSISALQSLVRQQGPPVPTCHTQRGVRAVKHTKTMRGHTNKSNKLSGGRSSRVLAPQRGLPETPKNKVPKK
eukprot:6457520-Amphidinium_carterae.1